jgi:ubiquinone biosynthesis protein UbiJ
MNEMQKVIALAYFFNNKETLRRGIKDYRENPAEMRNLFAEHGKEVTPQELKDFCDQLDKLIEDFDERLPEEDV